MSTLNKFKLIWNCIIFLLNNFIVLNNLRTIIKTRQLKNKIIGKIIYSIYILNTLNVKFDKIQIHIL